MWFTNGQRSFYMVDKWAEVILFGLQMGRGHSIWVTNGQRSFYMVYKWAEVILYG